MKPEKSLFSEQRTLNKVKEDLGGENILDRAVQTENAEQIDYPLDPEEAEILEDMRIVVAAHEVAGSTVLQLENSGQTEFIKIPVEKAAVASELGLQTTAQGNLQTEGKTLASLTRHLSRSRIGQFMLAALAMAATFSTVTGCDESGSEKPAESSSANPDDFRTNKNALTSTNQLTNLDHTQVQEACWTQNLDRNAFQFEIDKPGEGVISIVAFQRYDAPYKLYYVEGHSLKLALKGDPTDMPPVPCPTPQLLQNMVSQGVLVAKYDKNSGKLVYDVGGLNVLSTADLEYNGGLLGINPASVQTVPGGNLNLDFLEIDTSTNPSRILYANISLNVRERYLDGTGDNNLGFIADNCGIPTPVINNSTPNSVYTYLGTQFSSPGGLDKCELAYAPTEAGVAGSVNRILSLYPKRIKRGASINQNGNDEILMFHATTNQTSNDSRIHFIEIPPEAGGICGDNNVDAGETCDDGNAVTEECNYGETNCQVCDDTCQTAPGATSYCGDNSVDASNGEQCDDGNTTPGDGCDATCQTEISDCGNGMTELGEDCDDGNTVTEICVYGETNCVVCDASCQDAPGATSYCGDNSIDASNGEDCDDGNTTPGDGCDATCQTEIAICGNNNVEFSEQCDDGNAVTETCVYGETSCVVCDASCQDVSGATSYCGDGQFDMANEFCEGANCIGCSECAPNYNGSNGICVDAFEICGNGTVAGGEICDTLGDPNCVDCTSCAPNFGPDNGVCVELEYCGDLIVNNGEFCDDLHCNDSCTSCVNGYEFNGNLCVEIQVNPEVTFDTSCESDQYVNERIDIISLIDPENPYKITRCDGQKFTVCGQGVIQIEIHDGYTPITFTNRGEQDDLDPTIFANEDGCFTLLKPVNEGINPTRLERATKFLKVEQDPDSHLPLDQSQIELEFEYSGGTTGVLGLSGTKVEMDVRRDISEAMTRIRGEVTEDFVTSTKRAADGTIEYSVVHRAGTDTAFIDYDENGPRRPDLPGEDVLEPGSDVGPNPDVGMDTDDMFGPDAGGDIGGMEIEKKGPDDDCGCNTLSGPKEDLPSNPTTLIIGFAAAVALTLRRRQKAAQEAQSSE